MIEFKFKLIVGTLLLPTICTGLLFTGTMLFIYIYLRLKNKLYLSMSLMGLYSMIFVGSEMMILAFGSWLHKPEAGMQFHRIEQVAGAFFIVGLPYLLAYLLELNSKWKKINVVVIYAAFFVSIIILFAAFIAPDLFISVTKHKELWMVYETDHGRGQEGILYGFRDTALTIIIFYSITCIIVDMIWHRNFKKTLFPLIGILFAISGAAIDIIFVYTKQYYDLTPNIEFSRFSLGISLFVLMCMAGIIHQFIDIVKEVAIARKKATLEAENEKKQNDFIKNVLKSSSENIYNATADMSGAITIFSENTESQAAATEEVTASIEEITGGADNVANNATEQHKSLLALASTMDKLSRLIKKMGDEITGSLEIIEQTSSKAKSGEKSLNIMNESMTKISGSSQQMTGIIEIINDIPDRINLLSLNAAIEAARAGDSGRGFAVVADEISKLADQTASSIKEISDLIRTNESEISHGTENVSKAVQTINLIITDIATISGKISSLSESMKLQINENEIVNKSAEHVRIRSEDILNAMNEQKLAIAEIAKTIGNINELAQNNTSRIEEMAESSKSLVNMVQKQNMDIEEYKL